MILEQNKSFRWVFPNRTARRKEHEWLQQEANRVKLESVSIQTEL